MYPLLFCNNVSILIIVPCFLAVTRAEKNAVQQGMLKSGGYGLPQASWNRYFPAMVSLLAMPAVLKAEAAWHAHRVAFTGSENVEEGGGACGDPGWSPHACSPAPCTPAPRDQRPAELPRSTGRATHKVPQSSCKTELHRMCLASKQQSFVWGLLITELRMGWTADWEPHPCSPSASSARPVWLTSDHSGSSYGHF